MASEELEPIQAQLALDERQLLYWLAREYFIGVGEIVDAGAFLGGSAKCLALGLRDSQLVSESRKLERIHSFDLFTYGKWILDKWIPKGSLEPGRSFLNLFHDNLAGLERYIGISVGDVSQKKWCGKDIEILFLDVCKSPQTNDATLQLFFPSLIEGRSLIIQQDYCLTSWNIWIYSTLEALDDYLELVSHTRVNSVVYLVTREITGGVLEAAMATKMSHETRIGLAQRAADRWPAGEHRQRIQDSIEIYRQYMEEGRSIILPVAQA